MYCGDGANDLCPALALAPGDVVLARKVCNFHMQLSPYICSRCHVVHNAIDCAGVFAPAVVGGLHVCISLHHTAIAKVVMKGVVAIDETPAHLTPTPSHDCFMEALVCDTEKSGKQKSIVL